MRRLNSIRIGGAILMGLAFAIGVLATALWTGSSNRWQTHLAHAEFVGRTLFDVLQSGITIPGGVVVSPLSADAQALTRAGDFERLSDVPRPALVTHLAANADPRDVVSGPTLKLAIVSSDLRYPLSELDLSRVNSPRETMGKVTRLMATYCSDAVIFAAISDGPWRRIQGPEVWGCQSMPADHRLMASLVGLLSLTMLFSLVAGAAGQFTDFAEQLKRRRRFGGADNVKTTGPQELRAIAEAVNENRARQRQHLADRALVLSGVTHDLGTPATRLKLRSELIEDPDLRKKFEADIDQMTGIIESVLTYTRAELSSEDPRRLSLTSLVESVVADYADVGHPVVFEGSRTFSLEGGQSIFMSRRGRSEITEDIQIILQARPVALRRALSNLIDNALKYGRHATVYLETDVDQAHVLIEDEGGPGSIALLEKMTAPFQRGENARPFEGFGMGLTIASAIALEHGGELTFEPGRNGVIARLSISRAQG